MTMPDPQIQNALTLLCQQEKRLFDLLAELKGTRDRVNDLGITGLNQANFDEALGLPNNAGELSHLTRAKLRRVLAAADLLDTFLTTAVSLDGTSQTPRKAIVDVIR
jgi:hypothetical protein